MTTDPDRRLAHLLTNHPARVRQLRDAFLAPPGRHYLAVETLEEALGRIDYPDHADLDDPETIDEVLDIIGDSLALVVGLLDAAGGPAASTQDLELLLNAQAVADVVLTTRDNLADDLEEAVRAAGWEKLGPRRWRPPAPPGPDPDVQIPPPTPAQCRASEAGGDERGWFLRNLPAVVGRG